MAVEIEPRTVLPLQENGRGVCALSARIRKKLANDFLLMAEFSASAGFSIVFGASGAGKTTLLDCIAGLTVPDEGHIQIGEQILFNSSQGISLPVAKRRVGYVFQDLALFPHMSVADNIQYGLAGLPPHLRTERSQTILKSFRISQLQNRRPQEISGGERQRVALARALVTDPHLLLLDEPLAALDLPTKSKILDDLREWNRSHRIPILYVTHSRDEVFALGENVIVLEAGRIISQGTPHQVMRAPRQETVAQLAGFENVFDAIVAATHDDRGTMTCSIAGSAVQLETPLVRVEVGSKVRVAISAGDILLATTHPAGLSARNIIPGSVTSLSQRDVMVAATVNCGVEMEVYLTLAARDSLEVQPGSRVWLVIKTHSCHLLAS